MNYFAGSKLPTCASSIGRVPSFSSRRFAADRRHIAALQKLFGKPLKRIGLETGPTSSWLYSVLSGKPGHSLRSIGAALDRTDHEVASKGHRLGPSWRRKRGDQYRV